MSDYGDSRPEQTRDHAMWELKSRANGPGLDPAGWDELDRLRHALGSAKADEIEKVVRHHHIATTVPALLPPLYPGLWRAVLQALRDAVTH
jgi:hypothetical protein